MLDDLGGVTVTPAAKDNGLAANQWGEPRQASIG